MSMNTGRTPIHCTLNDVASLSSQPFLAPVSSTCNCSSAASLSIENDHS